MAQLWEWAVWLNTSAVHTPLPIRLAVGAAVLGVLGVRRSGRQTQVSPVSRW